MFSATEVLLVCVEDGRIDARFESSGLESFLWLDYAVQPEPVQVRLKGMQHFALCSGQVTSDIFIRHSASTGAY